MKEKAVSVSVSCPKCGFDCEVAIDGSGRRIGFCFGCAERFELEVARGTDQSHHLSLPDSTQTQEGKEAKSSKATIPGKRTPGEERPWRTLSKRKKKRSPKSSAVEERQKLRAEGGGSEAGEMKRDPSAHRLNPDKETKLVAIEELAAASGKRGEEWRVDALEKPSEADNAARYWSGKHFATAGVALVVAVSLSSYLIAVVVKPIPTMPEVSVEKSRAQKLVELSELLAKKLEMFLKAGSNDERARFVRYPERTYGQMLEYYSREAADNNLSIVDRALTTDFFVLDEREFVGVVFALSDGTTRASVFEEVGDKWLLDWASFVGYSEISWKELLDSNGGEFYLMRAIAEADDYYNYDYSDEGRFACFRLHDVSRTPQVWAYCEREGPIHRRMAGAIETARQKNLPGAEVVVRVGIAEGGAATKQVWLQEFVQAGHVIP